MKKIINYWFLILLIIPLACQEEFELKGVPPTEDDAQFSFEPTEENDNIIEFTNTSDHFLKTWDLGNGQKGKGNTVTGIYPDAGTYTVTLTVYNEAGSNSYSQEVFIAESDPTLLDKPIYNMLTGGNEMPEGKTWVIDSAYAGHFGVGPDPVDPAYGPTHHWYAAGANEKQGGGMYDDRYTFILADYGFEMDVNGDVYINAAQGPNFPGAVDSGVGDLNAPYSPPEDLQWNIAEPEGTFPQLTISDGGFIGYYAGSSTYQIISLSENEMFLRTVDAANEGLAWYMRLIPAGFDRGGDGGDNGGGDDVVALPIDFESEEPVFATFGGSTYSIVDNPDKSGINTSNRVLETAHGHETWAGINFDLSEPLDFSDSTILSVKVYAPQTGTFKFKLENIDNPADAIEIDQEVNVANEWVELQFDFSEAASDVYGRVVLFPGWNVPNAGTFYIDDIKYAATVCPGDEGENLDPTAGDLKFTFATEGFGQFGNIASEIVDNPDPSGINTSCNVNMYAKSAGCETWSGVAYEFDNPIDFGATESKIFKMKVYAQTQTAEVKLRLERLPHPDVDPAVERTATISSVGEWEELTFDFSDVTDPLTFKVMLVYFEQGASCDDDVYFFDDIVQQ